jgi:hypothetical protein
MSLTYDKVLPTDYGAHNFGDIFAVRRRVTFDSSYPSGGYSIGASKVDMPSQVLGAQLIAMYGTPPADIAGLRWNSSTGKLQVLGKGNTPPLIVEEVVAVSSNAGRLSRVPGYIIAVQGLAGTTTGSFRVIPTGKTPVTRQVAVNFVTGAIATLSTDVVTSMAVTYIPLGVGLFTEANRVVDEAVTLATAGVDLANRAAVIQYVWNNTASGANRLPAIQPVGESPSSNQIAIDINNAGATTITPNSAQDTNAALVTYFKYGSASAWVSQHSWTDQADIAVTSNAIALNEVLDIGQIWIPGFGNVIVGETGASANLQSVIQGPRGSTAANVCTFDPLKGALAFTSGDSYATIEMPYVLLSATNSVGADGDVPTGANLSALVADVLFFGV